jgi:hypothetical protein
MAMRRRLEKASRPVVWIDLNYSSLASYGILSITLR